MKARDFQPSLYEGHKILPSDIMGVFGTGNVYYVISSAETFYSQFLNQYDVVYEDGSKSVVTCTNMSAANVAIQEALDRCVAGRNDYVVILPSATDYDIVATLTMNKRSVHLIAPAGFGYDIGANASTKVEMKTAATAHITMTAADSCEVAGFYFKDFFDGTNAGGGIIAMGAGSTGLMIHHNHFVLKPVNATNVTPLKGTSTGGGYGRIYRNWFEVQASGAYTTPAFIESGPGAVAIVVEKNHCVASQGQIFTYGIAVGGQFGTVMDNIIIAQQGNVSYASDAATIGVGVQLLSGGSMCAIGNRFAGCDANLAGGTATKSYVDNLDSRTTVGTDVWNLEA